MNATKVVVLWLTLCGLGAAQKYKITDLGSLGANQSEALSINFFGHVAGDFCLDARCSATHPFLWIAAAGMQDLGTLPSGDNFAIASGLNLFDQVVGSSAFAEPFAGETHAFIWTKSGGMQDLGTLGCPDVTGANGINLFGQVIGTSTIEPCPGGGQDRAFFWSPQSGMINLGTLSGGSFSFGNAINDFGQAVGYSDCSNCTGYHAFRWDRSGMTDLGVLPGGSFSVATAINNLGAIVGNSDEASSGGMEHAFLWKPSEGFRDLGTLRGGQWSSASAVSDLGKVVGTSDAAISKNHAFRRQLNGRVTSNASHAFIWSADEGMRDLNELLISAHTGWVLVDAHSINSFGQIAGVGIFNSEAHAFLLTPVVRRLNQ